MVLGLLGVGLVANPDSTALLGGGIGIPLLFGAAVTSALGAVVIRRRAESTMSSTARTVWGVPLAAVLSHGLSLSAGESVTGLSVPPVALAALLYVGVFSGAIAYLAYFALIDETDATQANLLFYFVPIVSAVGAGSCLERRCRSSHWSGLESSSSVSCSSVVSQPAFREYSGVPSTVSSSAVVPKSSPAVRVVHRDSQSRSSARLDCSRHAARDTRC